MKSKGTVGTSLTKVKEAILFRRFLGASVVGMAVFVLAFVMVPYLIGEANAAVDAQAAVTWSSISLTLDPDYIAGGTSGTGDIDFGTVVPTSIGGGNYGTQKVVRKTIKVTTTGNYYAVYLSMIGNSNSLEREDDSTQDIDAINDGSGNFGEFDNTLTFDRTGWGYAVPTSTVAGADFIKTDIELTDYTGYDGCLANLVDPSSNNMTVASTGACGNYNHGAWAAVPTLHHAQQIYKNSNLITGFTTGDTFDIYYSIMVDTDVMAGTYRNQVVYTALASTTDIDSASSNISRDKSYVSSGTLEALRVDLASNPESLTTDQVKVFLVPHSEFVTGGAYAGYTKPNLTLSQAESAFAQCEVTAVASQGSSANVTCRMPAPDGDKVKIVADNEAVVEDGGDPEGEYDLWLHIEDFNVDYISQYTSSGELVASVVYAGLQSINVDGDPYVEYMQDIEPNICNNTNMWGNIASNTGARIYDYRGNGATVAVPTPLLEAGEDELGVSSFKLLDNRDEHPYLVRRLADGNCWMVQNLDLNLASFVGKTDQNGGLTPANTDLSANRSYWDPSKTAYNAAKAIDDTVSNDQASYFPVISYNKLGTAQAYQFQPKGTSGATNHWGSKRNEDGDLFYDTATNPAVEPNPVVYTYNRTDEQHTGTAAYVPKNRSKLPSAAGNTIYAWQDSSFTGDSFKIGNNTTGSFQTTTSGAQRDYVENNSLAEMPRSYDHGWDYVSTTASSGGSTVTTDTAWVEGHAGQYYGDNYNWYAATAETGTWSMTSGTTTDSICPKGWKLPVNGGNTVDTSWAHLITGTYTTDGTTKIVSGAAGSQAMRSLPLSIPFTGSYNWVSGNASYNAGSNGYFWSSTAYSQTSGYYLYFNSSNIGPQHNSNKVGGLTIRCVARS